MQVFGEGNGPLGTASALGTFEIFFGATQGHGGQSLQHLLAQRHHLQQQIAHAKKTGHFKGAHAKQMKKHLAHLNAQIKRLQSGAHGGQHRPMRRARMQMLRHPGHPLMRRTPLPQLQSQNAIPRLPDTAPSYMPDPSSYDPGSYDPGPGPEPSAYDPYAQMEAEPGFNQLVPLDDPAMPADTMIDTSAGDEDMSGFRYGGYGRWGGAWSNEAIPTAPLAVFTQAERDTPPLGLLTPVGDFLNGLGSVVGLGDVGDLLVGSLIGLGDVVGSIAGFGDSSSFGFGDYHPADAARIEQLKNRKKIIHANMKHASGATKEHLKEELKQINHLLHLLRRDKHSGKGKHAKLSARAKAADKALNKSRQDWMRKHHKKSSAVTGHTLMRPRRWPWSPKPRFVPPGYPPVPGYGPSPYPYAPPGQVPGTYMVPGGDLPQMPAGGPGYMQVPDAQTVPGTDAGDMGDDDKPSLWKWGLGIAIVGGGLYALSRSGKGRGPKLSKAERRARRAGRGGPGGPP